MSGAQKSQTYKPSKRNSPYSGAENSCLRELNRLSRHYHPSVSHFAHTLMKVSCSMSVFYYPWLESIHSVTVCKYSIFFVAFFAQIAVLENSRHLLNHLNKELKQTTTWSLPFSGALGSLVFTSSFHWLFRVCFSLLIGRCDFSGVFSNSYVRYYLPILNLVRK